MITITHDEAIKTYKRHKEKLDRRLYGIKEGIKAFMRDEKQRYELRDRQRELNSLDQLEKDFSN